jgi:hypothetical protein
MQDFCRAVRHGTEPFSSADLGLEVVRMIEAVDRSLATGGTRVALDPGGATDESPLSRAAEAVAFDRR